tara:strand:- start:50 stop:205 length:156 start_codon:yes stop_codon:yes gene_type:complete
MKEMEKLLEQSNEIIEIKERTIRNKNDEIQKLTLESVENLVALKNIMSPKS